MRDGKGSDGDGSRIEKQRPTTYGDLLEPSTHFSGDAKSKRSKPHNECGVFR